MKLSFKKEKRMTGLMGVGYPHRNVDIKVGGKRIGFILPPSWTSKDNMWEIYIAVEKKDIKEDGNPNCSWKWDKLRPEFFNEDDARDYIKTHKQDIFNLNLHYFDD